MGIEPENSDSRFGDSKIQLERGQHIIDFGPKGLRLDSGRDFLQGDMPREGRNAQVIGHHPHQGTGLGRVRKALPDRSLQEFGMTRKAKGLGLHEVFVNRQGHQTRGFALDAFLGRPTQGDFGVSGQSRIGFAGAQVQFVLPTNHQVEFARLGLGCIRNGLVIPVLQTQFFAVKTKNTTRCIQNRGATAQHAGVRK